MLSQRLSSLSVWDDAYMFVRYANNLLQDGDLAWNPGGDSVYGLTSLAYLFIVIPLKIIVPTEPALVMILSSLISGLLAIIIILWLVFQQITLKIERSLFFIIICISLVVAGDGIAVHLTSGMDTMFTIFAISLWMIFLYVSNNCLLVGIVGGLMFTVRPDVLIIVIGIVPSLLSKDDSHSQLRKYVAGVSITLFIQLLVLWLYFGHPIPLPFYAKNTPLYGQEFYDYYSNTSWGYFLEFIRSFPYLLSIIFFGLITQFRKWDWQDKGLLLGGILFCVYHVLFVVPIMGFSQRFFYPLLPLIVILAGKSLHHILETLPKRFILIVKNYPIRILFVPLILIFAFINPMPIILTMVQLTQMNTIPSVGIGKFDLDMAYQYLYTDNWYALDELSHLDNEIVIATTEIGLPSVMNPNKQIVDLAGLNQPNFAFNGFSADWLMQDDNQPDWIYMPFPHYEQMWFSLFEHPIFQGKYHFFPALSLGTSMDVAIRQDSPFYSDMLSLLNNDE